MKNERIEDKVVRWLGIGVYLLAAVFFTGGILVGLKIAPTPEPAVKNIENKIYIAENAKRCEMKNGEYIFRYYHCTSVEGYCVVDECELDY